MLVSGLGLEEGRTDGEVLGRRVGHHFEDLWFGVGKDRIQTAQDSERKNEVAILVGFEITP
ncbi:hypothetical protein GCM10009715_21860 [Paeniglutamicibacter psychrophenolicus]